MKRLAERHHAHGLQAQAGEVFSGRLPEVDGRQPSCSRVSLGLRQHVRVGLHERDVFEQCSESHAYRARPAAHVGKATASVEVQFFREDRGEFR
jgi:hypothetical protein